MGVFLNWFENYEEHKMNHAGQAAQQMPAQAPMTGVQEGGANLDQQLGDLEQYAATVMKRLSEAGVMKMVRPDQTSGQSGGPTSVDTRCPHAIFLQHSGDRVREVRLQLEDLLNRLDI